MLRIIKNALIVFAMLWLLCGVFYPWGVTKIAQYCFPEQANGSLIYKDGRPVGSRLIAQNWTSEGYFHGRPSGNEGGPNNAMTSGGTNYGPTSLELVSAVRTNVEAEKRLNPKEKGAVPQDLATSSGSGLDPDISPEAARWQAARIAEARGVTRDEILALIKKQTRKPVLHFLGEERVNVLEINLALDEKFPLSAREKTAPSKKKNAR